MLILPTSSISMSRRGGRWNKNTAGSDGSTPADPLLANLTHAWLMDELSGIRYDSVGTMNLTANGSLTNVTGKDGKAAYFRTTQSNDLHYTGGLDHKSIFHCCLWFKMETLSTLQPRLIADRISTNNFRWSVFYEDSLKDMRFNIQGASGSTTVSGASTLVANTWYMLDFYWDNTTMGLAYNAGTHQTQPNPPYSMLTSVGDYFFIGAGAPSTPVINWTVDLVYFWKNRKLTDADRIRLYNDGNGLNFLT